MLDVLLYAGRAVLPLLLLMGLGVALRRLARWDDDFYRQLNGFCFHVLLPVQLFLNVYHIQDLSALNWRLLGYICLAILAMAGLGMAIAPLLSRSREQQAVIAQASFRSNQVIMGIPLAAALGGEEALVFASLATSVSVPVFNLLAVLVLTAYCQRKPSWQEELRRVCMNPLILGAALGLVAVLLRQLIPVVDGEPLFSLARDLPIVYQVCEDLSGAASTLVLVILGARLRFDAVQGLWRQISATVLLRLVAMPLLVLIPALLLRQPLGLTAREMPSMIAIFCSPVAVTSAVMVQEIGGDQQLAQQVVAWSSALSMLSIFCFAAVLRAMGLL